MTPVRGLTIACAVAICGFLCLLFVVTEFAGFEWWHWLTFGISVTAFLILLSTVAYEWKQGRKWRMELR